MKLDVLRRMSGALLVLMMGLVAALPYHLSDPSRTDPFPLGTAPELAHHAAPAHPAAHELAPQLTSLNPPRDATSSGVVPSVLGDSPLVERHVRDVAQSPTPSPTPLSFSANAGATQDDPAVTSPSATRSSPGLPSHQRPPLVAFTQPAPRQPAATTPSQRRPANPAANPAANPPANPHGRSSFVHADPLNALPVAYPHPLGAPGLVLDPEQPPRPVQDHQADHRPFLPKVPTDQGVRPSAIPAPARPAMAESFPEPLRASSPNVGGTVSSGVWSGGLTPVTLSTGAASGTSSTSLPPSGMDIVQNRVRPHPELRSYAPSRTHKIRDGDTLANIAQRMLGDAGRANELFELNRNVLPSPQLLPLGVEIKIPAMDGRAGTSPPGMTPVYMPRE